MRRGLCDGRFAGLLEINQRGRPQAGSRSILEEDVGNPGPLLLQAVLHEVGTLEYRPIDAHSTVPYTTESLGICST